jgi:hypothetical protein
MRRSILTAASVLLASLALAAAVRAGEDSSKPSWLPSSKRALIVVQSGDEVTLQWKSEKGYAYTIMYTDKPQGDARWEPLPGYVNMAGTGKQETLQFKIDPIRPRRFNLRVAPAKKGSAPPPKRK